MYHHLDVSLTGPAPLTERLSATRCIEADGGTIPACDGRPRVYVYTSLTPSRAPLSVSYRSNEKDELLVSRISPIELHLCLKCRCNLQTERQSHNYHSRRKPLYPMSPPTFTLSSLPSAETMGLVSLLEGSDSYPHPYGPPSLATSFWIYIG